MLHPTRTASLARTNIEVTEKRVLHTAMLGSIALVSLDFGRDVVVVISQSDDAPGANDPNAAHTGPVVDGEAAMHPVALAGAGRRTGNTGGRGSCEQDGKKNGHGSLLPVHDAGSMSAFNSLGALARLLSKSELS